MKRPLDWKAIARAAKRPENRDLLLKQLADATLVLAGRRAASARVCESIATCREHGFTSMVARFEAQRAQILAQVTYWQDACDRLERILRDTREVRA